MAALTFWRKNQLWTGLPATSLAWGLWADSVRERAEQRLAVTDLDDPRVLSDPEYGQALDAGGVIAEALRAAGAVLRAGVPGMHK